MYNVTNLAKKLEMKKTAVTKALVTIGYQYKSPEGSGFFIGEDFTHLGEQKSFYNKKDKIEVPYVIWNESIITNNALLSELNSKKEEQPKEKTKEPKKSKVLLSVSKIADKLEINKKLITAALVAIGYQYKSPEKNGYFLSEDFEYLGEQKSFVNKKDNSTIPYVVWNESILTDNVLLSELNSEKVEKPKEVIEIEENTTNLISVKVLAKNLKVNKKIVTEALINIGYQYKSPEKNGYFIAEDFAYLGEQKSFTNKDRIIPYILWNEDLAIDMNLLVELNLIKVNTKEHKSNAKEIVIQKTKSDKINKKEMKKNDLQNKRTAAKKFAAEKLRENKKTKKILKKEIPLRTEHYDNTIYSNKIVYASFKFFGYWG